jgi:hypothetical protein
LAEADSTVAGTRTDQDDRTATPGSAPDAHRRLAARAAALVALMVMVGFTLRLGFGLGYWVGKPLMKDEEEYLLLATRLATGRGFNYPPPPPDGQAFRHFERPPAFAAFLATVLTISGDPLAGPETSGGFDSLPATSTDVPVAVKVAQSALGAIAIWLVAALAWRAAGARAAVAAAAMAAVYPPAVWTCGYVLSEPLYSVLALGSAIVLLRAGEAVGTRQLGLAAAAGLAAGAAVLTKEAMLFFLPMAAAWLVAARKRAAVVALALGVAAVTLPWIARNYVVHDRFILTAAHGGVTLWTGNNPLARGEGDLAANPDMGLARVAFENRHPGASNQDLDSLYYREVAAFVREHPVQWLMLEAKKLFYTFVPIGPSYQLHSRRYYVASLVSYGLLAPLAVAGIWLLLRRGRPSRVWALWLLAASSVLVNLVFFPQERFRIPVLDPSAIVAASAWWALRHGGDR